jgi:hypothetical protein
MEAMAAPPAVRSTTWQKASFADNNTILYQGDLITMFLRLEKTFLCSKDPDRTLPEA